MRNLKIKRQLRGQTASGLRRKLREKSAELAEVQAERDALLHENARLRRRPPQKLPIPETFSDMLIDRLCDHLARGMARKVASEVPELERAAHACTRHMHSFLQGKMSMGINSYADIEYVVEEMFRDNDVRFSLHLHGVDVHYREDLRHIRMMEPWSSPDPIKEPKRVVITNRDFAA
ncbi:hypothetical protein MAL1_00156 [Bacteriophage DSS3_MAL1]|nr:hypothetical protein MAL1_00156 [Bacteriophage DSS3_MAL1]